MNTMQLSIILVGPSLHRSQPIVSFYSSSAECHHQIFNRISKCSRPSSSSIRYADYSTTTASSSGKASGKSSDESSTDSRNDSTGVVEPSQAQSQKSEVSSASPQKPTQPEELPSDMTELVQWGGTLPSGRRIVVGAAVGLAVALGSDFIGITSLLLGLAPDLSRELRTDLLYPVQGFKRCYEASRGFGECSFPFGCRSLFSLSSLCFNEQPGMCVTVIVMVQCVLLYNTSVCRLTPVINTVILMITSVF